jgi:hypothetical protein
MSIVVVTLAGVLAAGIAVAAALVVERRAARRHSYRMRSQVAALEDQLRHAQQVTTGQAQTDRPATAFDVVPRPEPPTDLIEELVLGECVLFAGAGCTVSAGLPTWPQLLSGIIQQVAGTDDDPDWAALEDQLDAGQVDLVAQILTGRLSAQRLTEAAIHALDVKRPTASRLLASLAALPFAGVVTDDWSSTVARAFADREPQLVTPGDAGAGAEALRYKRAFVLQAYGALPGQLLLSFDDYQRVITEERDFALFVGTLIATRSMLFIGTSVAGVEQFCIGSGIRGPAARRHYALVPQQAGLDLQRERLLNRYGVELLPYAVDEGHSEVPKFVEDLAAAARRAGPKAEVRPPDQLERIRLTDIGPFRSLDLELMQPWSVILGNNAVGKTTVLRAVALALAGSSPRTTVVPSRLLRTGASVGVIELTFGGSTYRTTLIRERDEVGASAQQITPVQSGVWLVVGLPALRGVSRSNPRGISTIADVQPSATDVMPLVWDEVDTRLDDLKAWIATHWLRSRDPASKNAQQHFRILNTFFKVLRRLTPGVDYEFVGIEAETGRVLLNTDDGEISFDELSLGVSAILGGIGVLLQRLYEVYPDDEHPERRNALLLIDELDAHLHPEWQSEFLPLLRETFEGLHLLATTHSPLIVANTRDGELHQLLRKDGGIEARTVESVAGWRVDQILTGSPFGVERNTGKEWAVKLEAYRDLRSARELTDEEQRQMQALAKELHETLPRPQSKPEQSEAAALLEEWLDSRLRKAPREEVERLIAATTADLMRLEGSDEEDS